MKTNLNNNIQESYCNFEVSKLLKEKGFIPAKYFGYITSFYHPKTKNILRYGMTGKSRIENLIYAVPQHIAIEWIRVNFDFHINTFYSYNDKKQYGWAISKINIIEENDYSPWISEFEGDKHFWDTPQEAAEAGIEYVLTNLI